MNLKRQLLLVSLLTLLLPWAGYEFIRETEAALRNGYQQMLAGTARAVARSMSQYIEEFPEQIAAAAASEQVFVHTLRTTPSIDGYFDDWDLNVQSLASIDGTEGQIHYAIGSHGTSTYLYVEITDRTVVHASEDTMILDDGPRYADRVVLTSSSPPYRDDRFVFATEAPGPMISHKQHRFGFDREPAIHAYWEDMPGGYRIEARMPTALLGTHLGIVVSNTNDTNLPTTRVASYAGNSPGPSVQVSAQLKTIAATLVEPGTRILVTDSAGWRIAVAGELSAATTGESHPAGWSERIYDWIVEPGKAAFSADPDPRGRERQPYVSAALNGREMPAWFRSDESGRAIVAAAAPIFNDNEIIGALILQQGTDAILSLTNEGLLRLINLSLVVTVIVAGGLLGYATWLSRRVRHLSVAAEDALENETLQSSLPSALAEDEIGDLSRRFSDVLRQLGDYNAYLRSLATKLSHELRTPLAIVTSSLENLEHEQLDETSAGYTARALGGADRLRRILNAMSEANRVEELMQHAESEFFDMHDVLSSAIDAYRDVYTERSFLFDSELETAPFSGAPELLIQMLDKLVDNAVGFSKSGESIHIGLTERDDSLLISVANPGPALPDQMRAQLFDSMVSVRVNKKGRHLGLGLYIAKLIAEGHDGMISADNSDDGVVFRIELPTYDSR